MYYHNERRYIEIVTNGMGSEHLLSYWYLSVENSDLYFEAIFI